jgi:lysophospholipase L1-like esterase
MRRVLVRALVAAALVLAGLALPGAVAGTAAATCDSAPLPGAPTVKVLVMGDSLTQQHEGDYTWRYRFWQYERAQHVNIDFVGPSTELLGLSTAHPISTDYADPCFTEVQHYALGGKDLAMTLEPVPWDPQHSQVAWATAYYKPNVVIGFAGYNDLKPYVANPPSPAQGHHGYSAEQLRDNAKKFVEEAQTAVPGTPVAMVTVASTEEPQIAVDGSAYNSLLAAGLPTWGDPTKLGLIDITRDWVGAPNDTWDGYHPNANGEMHLAWDVADGLHAMGLVPALPRPIPVQPLGPPHPAGLSLVSGTASSVRLAATFPLGANRLVVSRRGLGSQSGWEDLPALSLAGGATQQLTIGGLAPDQYEFRVRAARNAVLAQDQNLDPLYTTLAVDLRPVGKVGTPTVALGYHRATVRWSPATTADRYLLRVRRVGATAWSERWVSGTSYPVTGLIAGARYDFEVVPARQSIKGAVSPVVRRTAQGTVNPAVPRPLVRAVAGHRLRITWRRAADATRYQVRVRPVRGAWRTLGWSTSTHLTSPRLVKGRRYAVAVVAWDSYVAGRTSPSSRFRVR